MITYKQLRARLHEAVIKEAYGLYDSGSGDKKVHDLEIPEQLQTLNVYIANISNKEYAKPQNALQELRTKMHSLGYEFKHSNDMPGEEEEYDLLRFGGRFGFIDDSGDVSSDDGFNDSGFILRVKFVKDPNTHLYTVYPEVLRIDEG